MLNIKDTLYNNHKTGEIKSNPLRNYKGNTFNISNDHDAMTNLLINDKISNDENLNIT